MLRVLERQNRPLTAREKIHRKFKIVAFVCQCCGRSRLRTKVGPSPVYCKTCSPGGSGLIANRQAQQCVNCKSTFNGTLRKFCSRICRETYHRHSGAIPPNKCKACERVFYHRTERTFCSDECKQNAWQRTCGDCGSRYTQKKNTSGKCRNCRKRDKNRASSVRLKVRRGKARTAINKISVHQCWQRDGGKCQICRKAIRLDVKWPDPMSMSVDHIVPLSKGGTDEESNVRAAHLGCNSRRGNKL